MSAASIFINADVVDIKRLDVGHHRVVGKLPVYAKRMTEHFAFTVRADKNRRFIIGDYGFELLRVVLCGRAFEDIRPAAVCSYKAAEEYGLKVLDDHLQDNKNNKTRFIVISEKLYISENANKVSLCFCLPHESGSLYAMLGRFNDLGLNLTKIESRPIPGKEFRYLFYLDFTGSVKSEELTQLLCGLCGEVPEFSFLGNYEEISAFDEEK